MPDDKKPEPAAKKKQAKTIAVVGVVALVAGLGFIWWRNRQAGGTSSSAASPSLSGTDMGDIIQTVQGPPGPAGKQGPPGKAPKKPAKKKKIVTDKKP